MYKQVLIESDWNLKHILYQVDGDDNTVLIESDWNLKYLICFNGTRFNQVLIESDWNLKQELKFSLPIQVKCINRIRLEFKGVSLVASKSEEVGINRIRLEFKGN